MASGSIDLSFVLLTWNSAAYVRDALDSIVASLISLELRYEVYIVDNGSTDGTPDILREYQQLQPDRFKPLFLLDNKGTTLARNIGLKQVVGRLICVMDSDVVLTDQLFRPLIEKLEQETDVGMVVPKILYPSGNWQKSIDRFPTLAHKFRRFFKLRAMEAQEGKEQQAQVDPQPVDYAISAFWLFKREILDTVGYLDERIFYSPEDVDYCLRIWQAGYRIVYDPSVQIVHHTQEISRGFKLTRAKLSHIKGLFYLFCKHRFFLTSPQFRSVLSEYAKKSADSAGLRILHVFDHSLPLHDGYSFRSLNLLREQEKRGWQPVAVTSPKHEEDLKQICPAKEAIEGFTFYRTGPVSLKSLPLVSELGLMHVLSRRILEIAKLENVDLIHAHSPILNAIPALWAGRKLGLPVVYEIRAFWEDAAVDQGSCKEWGLRYRLTRAAETWVCNRVGHVAILCNGLKNDLVARGIPAGKITPVFNGVNPDDFQPCPVDAEYQQEWGLKGKKVIGFIGSFYRYEGLDLLIRSFAHIAKQVPEAVLLLVGGGEMAEELRTLVESLKLTDRIHMPGRIPHHRVPGVYAMVDILVYPRYSMRLTELVTPLKPLEAMAMGKALIASDVGGHRELIKDSETGVLFNAGDENALTNALTQILTNDVQVARLQENGREWVREWQTWPKTTSAYQQIYSKLTMRVK